MSFKMSFLLRLCALYFIFLNLFVHTHSQDIFGAILGGVQNGINLLNNNLNNNLNVGQRDYPDYGLPANRDVSLSRSNEASQSNHHQNDSEESDNSSSEQSRGSDSNSDSEEYDRGNPKYIENQKRFPINNQMINNNDQNSPNRQPSPFNGNIQNKPIIRKPILLNNQNPIPLKNETLGRFITQNKDKIKIKKVKRKGNGDDNTIINNATNITRNVKGGNSTVTDKPNLSGISGLLNQSTLNSTHPVTDKTIKEDKIILKSLTKRKFYFQAKPVLPLSEEVSTTETIYYIDLD